MDIKGFIPNTMLDWEGMLASTVFLPRCNFRCPFCQNPDLVLHPERLQTVPLEAVRDYLSDNKGWVDGVCVTGGEPCMNDDLPGLLAAFKGMGVGVKLDTNASYPDMLERLLEDSLLDFVSVDVKAPMDALRYGRAIGVQAGGLVRRVDRGIRIVRESGLEHEFRTTVVPILHGPEEVAGIAEYLAGEERYVLQYFSPRETLDPRYSSLRPFNEEDMERMLEEARRWIPGTRVRGAPEGHSSAGDSAGT